MSSCKQYVTFPFITKGTNELKNVENKGVGGEKLRFACGMKMLIFY